MPRKKPIVPDREPFQSLQEIYDAVRKHLLTQNKKAMKPLALRHDSESKPACAYRTYDGLCCAVGGVMPDSIYQKKMEGLSIQGILSHEKYEKLAALFPVSDAQALLVALQRVHDRHQPERWPDLLAETAHAFGLNPYPDH